MPLTDQDVALALGRLQLEVLILRKELEERAPEQPETPEPVPPPDPPTN